MSIPRDEVLGSYIDRIERLTAENAELKAQLAESKLMLQEAQAYGKAQQKWAHEWRDKCDDLEAERALIVARAENAEATLETCDLLRIEAMNACTEANERHSRYVKAVGELAGMAARLAEADALLRWCDEHWRNHVYEGSPSVHFLSRIDAFLAEKRP